MLSALADYFAGLSVFHAGVLASLFASFGTGVGAVPVLAIRSASRRLQDTLLGTAAGIMLAATSFSLILPGLDAGAVQTGGTLAGAMVVGIGIAGGGGAIWLIHRYLPHEHFLAGPHHVDAGAARRMWLFVFAITLHNIPEGVAVGVGFGGGNVGNGLALTIGIFLQNLPEGFVVALALISLGYGRIFAVLVALATGVVETFGGFVGAGFVSLSQAFLPLGLAGAAGAMLFVIAHEIIPETQEGDNESSATFGLLGGFVLMMILDVAATDLL